MQQPAAKQFAGIFVSYRRDDASGHAGRLFDRLGARFGTDQVFMDIDHIEPGERFDQIIQNAVGSCEILIAVIGRHWLSSSDGSSRRLDNPKDFVRLEIVAALNRDIRVIPVLVQGATMPRPQDLPDDLSELSSLHALELSDLRWQRDVDQLILSLDKVLAQQEEARRRAKEEEEERQRKDAEAIKHEEAQQQIAEKLCREEADSQLREELERQRREAQAKKAEAAERIRDDEEGRRHAQMAKAVAVPPFHPPDEQSEKALSPPPVKTIPDPLPEKVSFDQFAVSNASESAWTIHVGTKRSLITGIVVLCVFVVGALVIWLMVTFSSSESSTNTAQVTTNATPSSPGVVVPNYKSFGNPLQTKRSTFKVALSPDGEWLASTGDALKTTIRNQVSAQATGVGGDEVTVAKASRSIAISPDGKLVAYGGEDGAIGIFDLNSRTTLRVLAGHKGYVFAVAFTPDSSRLISASADKTVRVWNVSGGQQENLLTIGTNELIVTVNSNNGAVALFGQTYKRLILAKLVTSSSGTRPIITGRGLEITCGVFSPDGQTFALGDSSDGKVKVWNVSDGSLIRSYPGPTRGEVGSVAFTPDGGYLAVGWNNGDIELRRTSDGASVQMLKGHTRVVRTLSFSGDGRTLASGAEDQSIRLWHY